MLTALCVSSQVGDRPRHMIALSYMRRTSYNAPTPGAKTHAGGGTDGRFLFAAECASAFSRDWWPAPARARHEKQSETGEDPSAPAHRP